MKDLFKTRFYLMGLMLFAVCNLRAQESVGVNFFLGYVISHHPEMQNMEAHIGGLELRKQWIADSSNPAFKNATFGFSAMYFWLGKPNINGSVVALIPHYEAPIFRTPKQQLNMRFGIGIGYITKPFSYPKNIQNKAIGTHLNGSMQMMLGYKYALNQQFSLYSGLGLTHFSNANIKKPNLGINMPLLAFGLHYIPQKTQAKRMFLKLDKPFQKAILVSVAAATKQITIDDPKRVGIYTLSVDYTQFHRTGHFLRLGTDLFLDRSYPYQKFKPVKYDTIGIAQVLEHGIRVGYEWRIGKIGALADVGIYTYRAQSIKRRYYFTVAVMYYPSKRTSLFVKLKTHLAVADYFSWGFGYQIYAK